MIKKELLTRNLHRIWVEQKDNFHKLLDAFLASDKKSLLSTLSIDQQKWEVLNKIFLLLNRSNHARTSRNTSPLTAMYDSPSKNYRLYELLDFNQKALQKISQSDVFQSITCMQAGR